ncbi:hypothetical protein KW850_32345 [Bacillus sp. sid0103]|uniref:hypothetical protein n=1 Tax=Bacillus sp. sid0103 TaxID=2856337 RepID=UPI001C450B0E|nr:hypothetical protein [Bacillus sp. sid0103]MBV7509770.1 hypothetical protein [Bacillus sp. sid0103]
MEGIKDDTVFRVLPELQLHGLSKKTKKGAIKPMAALIYDLLPADVQTALYYLTIKTKNKKGDRNK